MNKKVLAISITLLTTLAAVTGALAVTTLAAADTNSTSTTGTSTSSTNQVTDVPQFGANMITGDQGFGGFRCGRGMMNGFGEYGNIVVSSDYTAAVNNILGNDTDVQNLVSQGYNVTAIHPIIQNVIEADGTITTKASTATVLMTNGTSGYSIVNVDVANAKVTQITTITKTVIDKSSS